MGYQRKELQILGGSFNLNPPGDKIPKTDYLLAQNWRVDRDGKLVSRYGYPVKFSFAGGVAHSAALAGGIEGTYYVVANDAGGAGSLYVNFNPTAVKTGLSGGRVGMAYMNGWMWIMDAAVQGKHQPGGALTPWGLQAPADACAAFAGSDDAAGPSGTYQFYVTFVSKDGSCESNPGPVSAPVTVAGQDINLSWIPTSAQTDLVGSRNIYATGGTMGQAYLVGTINDNTTAQATFNTDPWPAYPNAAVLPTWNDLSATDNGQVMPTTNDPPPAGNGMVGPYFSRLIAWKGSRLFWTDPDLPQYWPGAADPAVGNWADVGIDGENILWCTMHTNVLVIYKERSIWRLVGDPDSGYLEVVYDGMGVANPWAVTAAGPVDYVVAQGGLYRFNMDRLEDMSDPLRPLFTAQQVNAGALTAPGSIAAAWGSYYGVALGYAMGKLYAAYVEVSPTGANPPLLVYSEEKRRWAYHRTAVTPVGFRGFVFDGLNMVGLTGDGTHSLGYSLDDFRGFYSQDEPLTAIECVYQSHFEDAGSPDNQKNWLEVVIDYELTTDSATVYALYDNGTGPLPANASKLGTLTGAGTRLQTSFALGADGTLAKNVSILIDCPANHPVVIHNVYLYYYEEARLALAASTIPVDLGVPKVKQCKELQLDIDPSGGAVAVNLYSDLPGNQLAVRQAPTVAKGGGRALLKFPFSATEGFLWRLALTALAGPFRLYAARLLMRVVGVYVEAYESAAGFVWDSMEHTFESGITHIPKLYAIALAAIPIKRFREISLEIDTFAGDVLLTFLTDLPGNAQQMRYTQTINTAAAGRRFVRCPLPWGPDVYVEGRLCRAQLSGAAKFVLYEMAVELLAVGVYVEAYEAANGAVYDSREVDFGTPAVKEARELELDIETTGGVTIQLYSDLADAPVSGIAATTGRQKVLLPLTVNADAEKFLEGRLLRLVLRGSVAYRLYGARVKIRPFGQYLTADETAGGALWDSTDLDLGTQTVKQLRELDLDIWAYGAYTVNVYTDLPGNAMQSRASYSQAATSGRTKVEIPLPQGAVPDTYVYGRLVRVTITSAAAFKLFGARIHARPVGVYVESYEGAGGAVWDSQATDLGHPGDKTVEQARFEIDSDGVATLTVYTDLPGEAMASRGAYPLTAAASGRHWATAALPAGIEGRSVRLVVSGPAGFRIYRAQVRAGRVGRYLAGAGADGLTDALNTLEFDFRSERTKLYKIVEIDLRADTAVTFLALTEQSGAMAQVYSQTLAATSGRQPLVIHLPPGIRGKLLRLSLGGGPARIYHVRVWTRPINEPQAKWAWEDYPLEESDLLPAWIDLKVPETPPTFTWADLPVAPTPTEWQWAPFPVNPTEAQWFWAKVLSVEETADTWSWVDVPFSVNG